mgnify:CR=1 FL=1|jgi:hypothetical protein
MGAAFIFCRLLHFLFAKHSMQIKPAFLFLFAYGFNKSNSIFIIDKYLLAFVSSHHNMIISALAFHSLLSCHFLSPKVDYTSLPGQDNRTVPLSTLDQNGRGELIFDNLLHCEAHEHDVPIH